MSPDKYVTQVNMMEVPVATVSDTLHAGFRQEFIAAEAEGVSATLNSGAGLGSSYLTLIVERPGKPVIYETIDARDFLPNWIDAALARADAPEPAEEPTT